VAERKNLPKIKTVYFLSFDLVRGEVWYSFICQGTLTRKQRRTFSVFESSCHLLLPV